MSVLQKIKTNLVANINYSKQIDSAINHKNILELNFIQRKSQKLGIKLIKKLLEN